eukprot:49380_1
MYHQIRANNNGQNRANHPQNRANNNRQIRANHPQNRDVNGPMCYQIRANNNRQNCANNNRQIPAVLAATQPNNAAQILSKRPLQKSISRLAKRIAHDMYARSIKTESSHTTHMIYSICWIKSLLNMRLFHWISCLSGEKQSNQWEPFEMQ